MSEISKILLQKEREFVAKYIKNASSLTDSQIDKEFDKIVKKIFYEKA